MEKTKMFEDSRYSSVPKIYYEDVGLMPLPVCPEFSTYYTHVVTSSDTPDGLARQYYGDSSFQWAILISNDVPFPVKLEMGTTLLIPDRQEVLSFVRGR